MHTQLNSLNCRYGTIYHTWMEWLNSPTKEDEKKKQQRVRAVKVRNARKAEERRKGKTRKYGRKGQTRKGGREGQTRRMEEKDRQDR